MGEIERSKVEQIKEQSGFLRGRLAAELAAGGPAVSDESTHLLKFHGIYQQDDRAIRAQRRQQGLDPDWIFMVRAAVPGGMLTPDQWLVVDRLADEVGNGTVRITSRQGIQWHHTRKAGLRHLVGTLDRHLVTTLGACGDVVRNTMACPAPLPGRDLVGPYVEALAAYFRPRTRAYYEIWIDGERAVTAEAPTEQEPIYGSTYLPRKFKMAFSFPGDNCVDVYSDDVGVAPHLGDGRIEAFTVLVGGGMGRSHNKPDTFPRLADPMCTVEPERLLELVEAIVTIQRDFGERADRKHARLKYLVEYWGLGDFRRAVERRLGRSLTDPRPLAWQGADDHLGWHRQSDDGWFLGLPVENGRIKDEHDHQLRTGLREAVQQFRPGVRLTPGQSILLTGISTETKPVVDALLRRYGIPMADEVPLVIRSSMACVALPTCGLAVTDAERALPRFVRRLHDELTGLGLQADAIRVRMTGCPNGCARPYNSEIGLVGRRMGRYDIHLGGSPLGTRLNVLVAENVPEGDLIARLRPSLVSYRDQRLPGESFGDFYVRVRADTPAAASELEVPA
jgi:sulfite reductase (ferredoxin)